jgi:hypothetical protein
MSALALKHEYHVLFECPFFQFSEKKESKNWNNGFQAVRNFWIQTLFLDCQLPRKTNKFTYKNIKWFQGKKMVTLKHDTDTLSS